MFARDEQHHQDRHGGERPEDFWRRPGVGTATPHRDEEKADHSSRQQRGAGVVDPVTHPGEGEVEHDARHAEGDPSDGDVHVEAPPPGQVLCEQSPDGRTGDGRDGEDGVHVALVLRPDPGRQHVADDRHHLREDAARAEALDGTEDDQLDHGVGEPGQDRAQQEDHDGDLEDDLPAVEIAELAVQRRGGRRGQQVGGYDPGQFVQAAEVPGDGRQRRRHDRLVERSHHEPEHQPEVDDLDLPVRERRAGGGAGVFEGAHRLFTGAASGLTGAASGRTDGLSGLIGAASGTVSP